MQNKDNLTNEKNIKEKFIINISVRNLVEFIMRSGDIDNRTSGTMSKQAMAEGTKMHKKIQGKMGIEYKAEVTLKISLDYENYIINLEGRADGIIEEDIIVVDEIKSMYADVIKFSSPLQVHQAQAMCYAYIYARQYNLDKICVQMTYCNLDTEEIKRFRTMYTFEEIEKWFEGLMAEYVKWSDYIAIEQKKKRASIQELEFPFEYRKGQRNIVVSVYKSILAKRNMFIQAPTGVGKTISTIYPAIRAAGEGEVDKIFYLTAKTITRTVAEESFDVLRQKGLHFRTVTITAKEKICPYEEVICNPDKCERAKGHFDRVNSAIFDIINNESSITREVIEKYAKKYNVCPFEMSLDISNFIDGIICDYNYVFDPYAKLKRYFTEGITGKYVFLTDEAHNLVERAREMYSAIIIKEDFLKCKKIIKDRSRKLANALDKCNREMLNLKRMCIGTEDNYTYTLVDETEDLVLSLLRLQAAMEKFLDDNKEFDKRDEILELYFSIRTYLDVYEIIDKNYVIYSDFNENDEFYVKLFCVNPSENLQECMQTGISTIFFSATLLPVNYYKELLSGNIQDYAIYIDSPFDTNKRLISICRDVSSKYNRRNETEYLKILNVIKKIADGCIGNYMVFFPSYKMLEEVFQLAVREGMSDECEIYCQTGNMKENEKEEFLSIFEKVRNKSLLAFCVLGGIFSEGIDLKKEKLIGSIVIGTGLPMVCSEREILKKFYDKYNKNGFDYSYRYPGMNKVLQAAGRVIRTDDDYGVIALLDERFMRWDYRQLFPREWNDAKIMDSKNTGEVIEHFWKYV